MPKQTPLELSLYGTAFSVNVNPLSHYILCMYLLWCKIVYCRKLNYEISFLT